MLSSTEIAQDVANKIVDDNLPKCDPETDPYQVKVTIHPYISNVMYQRELELLENERINTFIALAKTLDGETVRKVLGELK